MSYTLGEAAKATGKSKPTIQRAITSGKISAVKLDDGSYKIEPAELHRVYDALPRDGNERGTVKQSVTPDETPVLRQKIEILEAERERERRQFEATVDDLRRRLDAEGEERRKLTALLTDQRPAEAPQRPRGGFWQWLVGRGTGPG